jgi:hypothetical protein
MGQLPLAAALSSATVVLVCATLEIRFTPIYCPGRKNEHESWEMKLTDCLTNMKTGH